MIGAGTLAKRYTYHPYGEACGSTEAGRYCCSSVLRLVSSAAWACSLEDLDGWLSRPRIEK